MEQQTSAVSYSQEQLEELSMPELVEIYKENLGKDPHHQQTKPEHLIRAILGDMYVDPEESSDETSNSGGVDMSKAEPAVKSTRKENEGLIIFRVRNQKKTGSLRVRDYRDPETGEIKMFKDRYGKKRTFLIKKDLRLDLSNEDDRLFYEHLKDHPVYVKTLNVNESPLIMEDQDQAAIDAVDREEKAMKARNIIGRMSEDELRGFARALGMVVAEKTSAIVIKDSVYKMCGSNPDSVMAMYNNPQRDTHVLIRKAIDKGIITLNKHYFYFEQLQLGMSVDEAIAFAINNVEILPSIKHKLGIR